MTEENEWFSIQIHTTWSYVAGGAPRSAHGPGVTAPACDGAADVDDVVTEDVVTEDVVTEDVVVTATELVVTPAGAVDEEAVAL